MATDCSLMMALSNDKAFSAALLQALQEIEDAIEDISPGGGGSGNVFTAVTWVPLSTIDVTATPIGGTYTTILNDANEKLYVQIINLTDAAIIVSFDGGSTDHSVITQGGSLTINPGAAFGFTQPIIKAKAFSASPTDGFILTSAYY